MNPHLCRLTILTGLALSLTASFVRAEDIPLRIVTWNAELLKAPGFRGGEIDKYRYNHGRVLHMERVAALIETLNPDILNLVEINSREAVELLVKILHEKGLTEFQGYHVDSHDTFTQMDVALITKFKPDDVDGAAIRTIYSEKDDPTWRQSFSFERSNGEVGKESTSLSRNSLYYFTIGHHKLGFLGLHLKANPRDARANARRMAEKDVAVRVIHAEIAARSYQPLVLGDLNDFDPDVPDCDDLQDTMTTVLADLKDFDKSQPGNELVNVASIIERQADRYTSHWDKNENGAHDAEDVYSMIDHILLPREMMPYVKRVFISHAVGMDTSDHFPVVVDLVLPSSN